ncbi:hypothetical protein QR680_016691 [Steinernema hermaphroditum]|uniref:Uncharacterized protein n=1 Tax=Steinernema hermaphroditum TaxID=289476 RepID=A0AA39HBZ9_9BILA|nr:hypothetical protein QR680_016691 [Steinernema hermaphroditum]
MNAWQVALSLAAVNVVLASTFYKYSTHPTPALAIGQLMIPLFVWETLLLVSLSPNAAVEDWLLLDYVDEVDLRRVRHRRPVHTVHSAGDVLRPQDLITTITPTDELTPPRTDEFSLRSVDFDEERFLLLQE